MKLKDLYESVDKRRIEKTCEDYGGNSSDIYVEDDGRITYHGDLMLSKMEFPNSKLPFTLKEVKHNFSVDDTNLISLERCPEIIGGSFFMSNTNIKDLKFFPKSIGNKAVFNGSLIKNFDGFGTACKNVIADSCKINSLKGLPDDLDLLAIRYCEYLVSLDSLPKNISKLQLDETQIKHYSIFFLKNVKKIEVQGLVSIGQVKKATEIINKHLPKGRAGLIDCQDELDDADLLDLVER